MCIIGKNILLIGNNVRHRLCQDIYKKIFFSAMSVSSVSLGMATKGMDTRGIPSFRVITDNDINCTLLFYFLL